MIEIKVLKKGIEGEKKANKILNGLSDDYYVLRDLNIRVDGR